MAGQHPNESTPIIIQPSSWKTRSYDAREEEKARRLIRDEVLLKRTEPYLQVHAKIKRKADGTTERIVAYLLRANTYTADVVEITTTDAYGVARIREGADVVDPDDDAEAPGSEWAALWADVDMVCGTPVPEIPTARQAVETVSALATRLGLRVRTLLGPEASVAAYQSALIAGVRAFYNVGHGYTGGIILANGARLTSDWFNGLAGRPVSPAVVYFNSCQVYNAPMQPAIMKAGARTFAGGIVNLLIGPSEQVSTDFWRRVLEAGEQMGPALRAAEAALYPVRGAHGIGGDLGVFGGAVRQAIVFEHANYGGRARALGIGRWDLAQIGLPNDSISSLRIPAGLKVTLYEDAAFRGSSVTFTSDTTFVGSFNDKTSSIVVEAASNAPAVDIFEHDNFQGMRKQLGPGRYNIGDMGLPNDCISSLRVGPGLKATLYEHRDFSGSAVSYVHDTSSVGSFNDKASSIVVEPVTAAVVEIFEHANFGGMCKVLGVGDYNLNQIGLPNDSLSSVRVPPGLEVVLYEHAGFTGASVRYTASTTFVGSFNDKTSSVRVRRRITLPQREAIPAEQIPRPAAGGNHAPATA